jgi:molecular chaperone DnaJ
VNQSPEAAERFSEISSAYSTLSDPAKRKRYDQFGEAGLGMGGGGGGPGVEVNLEDIFDSFFGGGGGGMGGARGARGGMGGQQQQRAGPIPGDDLRADLELSFETACFGGRERVKIQHMEGCVTCSGSGVKPGAKVSTCATCGGNGVVVQVTRTPLGNFQTQTTCPQCRGSGQSVSDFCGSCSGQGLQRKSKQVRKQG